MRLSITLFALLLGPVVLAAQQYFPPGVLGKTPQSDEFKANWYSKHLKALREPSLWELSRRDPNAEVYRFLWLRSFHHPIVVRLVLRRNGSGWMHARMTTGHGGYELGRIARYNVFWLRKAKTQSFLRTFESANFWNLPTLPEANENFVTVDGAQWIIEGVLDGGYHIIDRTSPDVTDPARAIGIMALKLGRFKVRSREMY